MSTEMRLARLGLLHLVDDPEALKSALKEKAISLRSNRHLQQSDIASISITKGSPIKHPNKPTERD